MTSSRTAIILLWTALFPALAAAPALAIKTEKIPGPSLPSAPGHGRPREVASGLALAKFSAGVPPGTKAALLSASGLELAEEFGFIGWTVVRLAPGQSVPSGLALLRAMPSVEQAEPAGVYRARRTSNDPLLHLQYGLSRMDAFRAWEYETGFSSRVTVAVVDTGIDGSHPDLSPKLVPGSRHFDAASGIPDSADPLTPACNHATRVAGVAAAASDNSIGVAGVSWGAKLISLKIFNDGDCTETCDDNGANVCGSGDPAIIAAIGHAVTLQNSAANGRIVLNMSLGKPGAACSGPLQAAVDSAVSAGVVLVAAAGNSAASGVDAPANCTGVIPAGATDSADNIASFSANGPSMALHGVAAPGAGVYTSDIGGNYASASGTSFSAPGVSGAAALVLAARPALTAAQVGDTLRNSADDLGSAGPDNFFGYGRVNSYKALLLAINGDFSSYTSAGLLLKSYAYPNPFRPVSDRILTLSVPAGMLGGELTAEIFNGEGERVRKLSSLSWDGKNDSGQWSASGVYLFLVRTGKGTVKGKFALIR